MASLTGLFQRGTAYYLCIVLPHQHPLKGNYKNGKMVSSLGLCTHREAVLKGTVPQANCVQPAVSIGPGLVTTMLPSFVSAVMVVVGWYVINKAQSNRERRKQIREYVSDLCDDLEILEALTIGYHTAVREEAKEQEIISKLGRFEKACSTLPRFLQSQKYWKAVPPTKLKIDGKRLQVLRKAMTLNHFGDEHTGPLSRHDVQIQKLELASVEMQEALEGVRIDSLD